MRRAFSAVLLMCMVALLFPLPTPAHATTPTYVEGYFDYIVTSAVMRFVDGNTFIYATEYEVWEGDFCGTANAVFMVIVFSSGFWYVWLRSHFEGSVDGKCGTMVIQLVGKGTYLDEDEEEFFWYGHWVIISGTGGLANIHGRGTWWGPGWEGEGAVIPGDRPDIFYEGEIHFD